MSERHITFKCVGHTKLAENLIGQYHLEVTDTRSGRVETVDVKPDHLISARSMKRILLGRRMFYTSTQKKHYETLAAMFDVMDAEAEAASSENS